MEEVIEVSDRFAGMETLSMYTVTFLGSYPSIEKVTLFINSDGMVAGYENSHSRVSFTGYFIQSVEDFKLSHAKTFYNTRREALAAAVKIASQTLSQLADELSQEPA